MYEWKIVVTDWNWGTDAGLDWFVVGVVAMIIVRANKAMPAVLYIDYWRDRDTWARTGVDGDYKIGGL